MNNVQIIINIRFADNITIERMRMLFSAMLIACEYIMDWEVVQIIPYPNFRRTKR